MSLRRLQRVLENLFAATGIIENSRLAAVRTDTFTVNSSADKYCHLLPRDRL